MPTPVAIYFCLVPSLAMASLFGQPNRAQSNVQLNVAEIVHRTIDAVVQIVVSDETGKDFALGSGFIVSADGEIVTNFHVIKGAHSAVVKLANGSFFPVSGVLALDADRDLALLKVDGRSLPFLTLEPTTALQVGDRVVAIGSPLGLEGTVSDGIVSAIRGDTPSQRLIQTNTAVSHGNSGGPLLDMSGRVVGVISSGIRPDDGQNLNFAIPSDEVEILLAKHGELMAIDAAGKSQSSETEPADSQSDDGKQPATDQLRAIAEAIKNCPPDMYKMPPELTFASMGFLVTDGPPTNVVWDVEPASSARARYLGSIEYFFPFAEMPPVDLCKQLRIKGSRCEYAHESFEKDYQREDAHPKQYKYEFDVTPHGLEFLRSFSKTKEVEGELWQPGGTDFCGRRAIKLVLGSTVPSK